MNESHAENQKELQREHLISLIVQALSHLSERELDLVARFIKTISE